jgi:uncharacterized membrane protein YccC
MTTSSTRLEQRLRIAGTLVLIGLLVELVTLYWAHPTAFLFFLLLGGSLMFLGMVLYLYSLVASNDSQT